MLVSTKTWKSWAFHWQALSAHMLHTWSTEVGKPWCLVRDNKQFVCLKPLFDGIFCTSAPVQRVLATKVCSSGLTEPRCPTSCCVTWCLQNATKITEVCTDIEPKELIGSLQLAYSGDIMMPVTWWWWLLCLFIVEGHNMIITGDCVYICDITAFIS